MKRLSLALIVLFSVSRISAQQVDWINSNPIQYTMNPGMVFQTVDASANGNIICSRIDTSFVVYNSYVYGRTIVECLDATSHVLWNYVLSDSAVVNHILTDSLDNIYISGRFLGTVILNGHDTIFNTDNFAFTESEFILKLSSTGTLIWKKNISQHLANIRITALEYQQNDLWFCTTDFFNCGVYRVSSTGAVTDSLILNECKGVTGIAFDSYGGLYLCGAAEMGTMSIGGQPVIIPDSYMMYIARLNSSSFALSWSYTGHDITFQSPGLVEDGNGGVYFAGSYFDSLMWGNISFSPPQWNSDFFLTRVDSMGNFLWGRSLPVTPTITGRFTLSSPGKFIDRDISGNVLLLGTLNGTVNWGSGVQQSGILGSEVIHVVSFDKSNQPLWQKTGGGSGNYPTAISTSLQGETYFAAAVTGVCTFDSTTVNAGGTLAAVLVKLIPASVGVEEMRNKKAVIYPNPAVDYVRIPKEWSNKFIVVHAFDGRVVNTIRANGENLLLDRLVPGNYILSCEGMYSRITVIKE